MSTVVESYHEKAWRWWADQKHPHGERCPCLPCADLRVWLGQRPLTPRIRPPVKAAS